MGALREDAPLRDDGLRWLRLRSGAAALIDPRCGGTVHRLRLVSAPDQQPIEILWGDESPATIGCETDLFRGRPLLPFADRIKGGRYTYGGRDYLLPINDSEFGDAIHGSLYRTPLAPIVDLEAPGDHETRCALSGTIPPTEGYPWRLSVTTQYVLRDQEFAIHFRVHNADRVTAPLSIGWHPYFRVPGAVLGTPVDVARLTIDADGRYEADEALALTGAVAALDDDPDDFRTSRPIGSRELDVGYRIGTVPGLLADDPAAILAGDRYRLELTLGGAFRGIQAFIPPGRAAIAIEPISAPGAAFTIPHLGLIDLAPGDSIDARAVVTLRYNS